MLQMFQYDLRNNNYYLFRYSCIRTAKEIYKHASEIGSNVILIM